MHYDKSYSLKYAADRQFLEKASENVDEIDLYFNFNQHLAIEFLPISFLVKQGFT